MISHKLKLIARQVLIDILSRLFARKVCARLPVLSKRFITQHEKRRINIQPSFDTRPANFTLSEMITCRQQFRGA